MRNHVPILLNLKEPNYSQWHCLFDSVLGKFGLGPHVDVVMDYGKSKSNWIFSFWTSLDWITLDVDVHMLN
jgi:hypothetical protein